MISIADFITNHTWVIGDALTSASNWIGNRWEDVSSFFTGDDPQYNQVADFYGETVIPIILYSPAAIFYNRVPALDVNFINPTVTYAGGSVDIGIGVTEDGNLTVESGEYEENEESTNEATRMEDNTAYQLRDTIAGWYNSLRDVAIVALLSVLVYVAIRIILSSTAGETAKYKEMLKDWVLALCLLFVMHYMMAFLLNFSTSVTNIINQDAVFTSEENEDEGADGIDKFMTSVRYLAQEATDEEGNEDVSAEFGFTIIYMVLVFYTLIFTWKYLMRLIYLAFLTMIAPLVAVTYPIDKISDGKAQAFGMWFREYLFNVLLQPMHMLLYTILITSVADFAERNLIYACVAIGFLLPAEKLLRSMFGFNKAEGGGLSAAITGGALFGGISGLTQKAFSAIPGGGSKSGSGGSGGSGSGSDTGKLHYSRLASNGAPKNLSAFHTNNTGGSGGTSGGIGGSSNVNRQNLGRRAVGAVRNRATGAKNAIRNSAPAKLAGTASGKVRSVASWFPNSTGGDIARLIGRPIRGATTMGGRFVLKTAPKVLKTGAKIGLTAALGAAGATMGIAGGLASDDYENVVKLGASGAAMGGFAGKKAYDGLADIKDLGKAGVKGIKQSKEDFIEGYHGTKGYGEYLNKKSDKEWAKDKAVIERFKRKYGEDYKKRMEDAKKLRKAGVTEQEDIEKAISLMKDNSRLSPEQAASIMDFSKGLTKQDLLTV